MLDLQVDIQGEKIILRGLQRFEERLPKAVQRGLSRVAEGLHRAAYDWLSGAGAKQSNVSAGEYPVPVRTGHLRRLLDWLKPGETKTVDGEAFSAGLMEAVVYDSAIYARTIHDGRGSSAKHGRRPFLEDAMEQFNRGDRIREVIEDEINREIIRNGL